MIITCSSKHEPSLYRVGYCGNEAMKHPLSTIKLAIMIARKKENRTNNESEWALASNGELEGVPRAQTHAHVLTYN